MQGVPLETVNSIPSDVHDRFHEMSLHAQELDLNSLEHLIPNNPSDAKGNLTTSSLEISNHNTDLDDILPSESFSTQASPATSLVDGVVPEKVPISIFQQQQSNNLAVLTAHPESTTFTSSPETPNPLHVIDRNKDDRPTRCSDVEDSPPLEAAGFVGDEIPSVDPLDSDGEWQPTPASTDLPTKYALSQLPTNTQIEGCEQMTIVEEKKKKKKKRKKSKAMRGAKALEIEKNLADMITGFEEYYADPPMKPDEAAAEEAMYDVKFSVAARAEKVIQRYRAARRFSHDRERIFSAYLSFGGIRTGPKQFQGLDPKMPGTAEDFAAASAKDAVEETVLENTEIDFERVIRGFLSYYFPVNHGWKSEQDIILACNLLANFLNYIEIHNVFPEYEENIVAAKSLVQKAKHELVINRKCSNLLPGQFNKACSTYFGGYYHGLYSGSSDEEFDSRFTNGKAMTFLRRARSQAFLADRKVGEWSFPCEVIAVVGQEMVLKQWVPEGIEVDYVEPDLKDTEMRISLESDILQYIYVGMHIEATWHQLASGVWYMDQVTGVLPTFAIEVPDEDYPEDDPEFV